MRPAVHSHLVRLRAVRLSDYCRANCTVCRDTAQHAEEAVEIERTGDVAVRLTLLLVWAARSAFRLLGSTGHALLLLRKSIWVGRRRLPRQSAKEGRGRRGTGQVELLWRRRILQCVLRGMLVYAGEIVK